MAFPYLRENKIRTYADKAWNSTGPFGVECRAHGSLGGTLQAPPNPSESRHDRNFKNGQLRCKSDREETASGTLRLGWRLGDGIEGGAI
jgi:hypothetical protein